jgi:uncharacterized protein (TIRG00374 family)
MKISLKSILIYGLLFCLGLLLVWLAFQGQDFSEIWKSLKNVRFSFIAYSLVFTLISHFLRSLRWNQLINPLGFKPSVWNAFQALMIGYLANLALPRVGEITRCGILSRTSGAPIESLFGTVITERIWDLISLLLITFFALVFQYDILSSFFIHTIVQPLLSKSPPLIYWVFTFSLVLGIIFLSIRYWRQNKTKLPPVFERVFKIWAGIVNGLGSFLEMKNKILFLVYTLGIWMGYAISTWLLFFAVDSTSGLGFNSALFILSAGSFGMVAPVQGGIGAYHWMVSHALLLYNIPMAKGLVYALVNHSSGVLLIILVGTFNLLTFFLNGPQKLKLET